MRIGDLLHLPLAALWQQKLRTCLTTLGVVFGSFVLAASLSVGQGVQNTIERLSHRNDMLRKIMVSPRWDDGMTAAPDEVVEVPGEMGVEKRNRIREALQVQKRAESTSRSRHLIDTAKFAKLKTLEHVKDVIPIVNMHGKSKLDQQSQGAGIGSAQSDNPDLLKRLVAGRTFDSPSENAVLVSEFLLYRLGIVDEAAQQAAVGKTLTLEFRSQKKGSSFFYFALSKPDDARITPEEQVVIEKIQAQIPSVIDQMQLSPTDQTVLKNAIRGPVSVLPETIVTEFKIVGILRLTTVDEEQAPWDPNRIYSEVVLPTTTAVELYFRIPDFAKEGLHQVSVIADDEAEVKSVAMKIKELGLQAHAPLEFIERERLMYLMIFGAMTCVAAVALLVAALGIANTMLMSVLERTREIGIMKAVGAGNGTLQFLFLTEGAFIGVLGGFCGLLLAWGASFPGDAWVRSMVERDMKIELKESIFVFPFWLSAVVIAFSSLVTTLAAVLPARRAARIDPVRALRHE